MFEDTGLAMTVDDLSMLSGKVVTVPLPNNETQLTYVYVAYAHVPYVTANPRTRLRWNKMFSHSRLCSPMVLLAF
jgi:hypothetical protein